MARDEKAVESTQLVLIVDDSATTREKLGYVVRSLGHRAVHAENGEQALERVKDGDVDMVLLDILMPGIDGFEVLDRMQSDENLRDIPVLVISSLEELTDVVTAIELGAEDFLTKSFDPVLLRARISTSLERKRLRDQEKAYLRDVDTITRAANVVETSGFDPEALGLEEVARRPDSLGDLARVFHRMADVIHRREVFYRRQITLLKGAFLLLLIGIPYGIVPTLSHLLAETDIHPIGVTAWVMLGNAVIMLVISFFRRKWPQVSAKRVGFALVVGLMGTMIPQTMTYLAAAHVPATIIAIVIPIESVIVYLVAAALGLEKPDILRLVGVCLGIISVLLIVVPGNEITGGWHPIWIAPLIIAALAYASETILFSVAAEHPDDPIQTTTLVMVVAAVFSMPLALMFDVLPGREILTQGNNFWVIPTISLLSAICTIILVITIEKTGSVFASQYVAPLTIAGVVWAMLILNEVPSGWVLLALAFMLLGMACVRPREAMSESDG